MVVEVLKKPLEKGELEQSYARYLTLMSENEKSGQLPVAKNIKQEILPPNVSIKHMQFDGKIISDESKVPSWKYLVLFLIICLFSSMITVITYFGFSKYFSKSAFDLTYASKRSTVQSHRKMEKVLLLVPGSGSYSNVNSACRRNMEKYLNKKPEKTGNLVLVDSLCNYLNGSNEIKKRVDISVIFQGPIQREIGAYLERQDPESFFYNEGMVGMSFDEYVKSHYIEGNYFTRALTCKLENDSEITEADLDLAKKILRKSNVLNPDEKGETIQDLLSHDPFFS